MAYPYVEDFVIHIYKHWYLKLGYFDTSWRESIYNAITKETS